MREKAYFHLPGLFEFYELYRMFLPLFREHREYFYDWCEIGSIYGAPADCIWGGGRAGFGENDPEEVLELMQEYGISARLTFSNSLLRQEHLSDRKCNALCRLFERNREPRNGVIIYSELLLKYLKEQYPGLYFVSSTTKVLTDFTQLEEEIRRKDFHYVVPDFRLNKAFDKLNTLSQAEKDKVEFLCNECCWFGCKERKACYEAVSRKNLGERGTEHLEHGRGDVVGADGERAESGTAVARERHHEERERPGGERVAGDVERFQAGEGSLVDRLAEGAEGVVAKARVAEMDGADWREVGGEDVARPERVDEELGAARLENAVVQIDLGETRALVQIDRFEKTLQSLSIARANLQ